ncbi:hypothetical protein KCU81_g1506, partial [Aureobasidium melanogenum]|uniref:Uncharacterized protein n=2 Tax=Aureobasidium melanogenum TaxID=46634 RepID=A0A074WV50_AURM1
MVPKPKKKASKAALKKNRSNQTTAKKVSEERQVPERDAPTTEASKSPSQTSNQLVDSAAPQKLQAIEQAKEQLEAVDDKIKRLEEMRKICENALTAVKELQKK